MARLSHRLALLRRFGRSAREAALLAAAPWAGPEEADEIGLELADASQVSGRPGAVLRGALSMWPRLSPAARSGVLSAVGDGLASAVEGLVSSVSAAERVAAAGLCTDLLNGARLLEPHEREAATRALVSLGADESLDVVTAAREGVLACARASLGGEGDERRALAPWLESALVGVLRGWSEHRDAGCIAVALDAACACGPALRGWFAETDEPAHMALRGRAKRVVGGERGAERVTAWLALPALAPVALECIDRGDEPVQTEVLRGAHLMAFRGRSAVLRRARAAERMVSSDRRLAEDGPPMRRASIRIARLVSSPDRRLLHLSGFLADPDALTRLFAVQALGEEPAGRLVDETLTDFALDGSPDVSAGAACVLGGAQSAARRKSVAGVFRTLTRSPHAMTRALAWLAVREFDVFGAGGSEGDRKWEHAAAAARALRSDRRGFLEALRGALRADTASRERIAALHCVERLRLEREVGEELVAMVNDRDQRVVAKVARVLSGLDDERSRGAVAGLLRHDDPRVRAEAVRGVGLIGGERVRVFLNDPVARVRGNAAAALARAGAAGAESAVRGMLDDARAAHRLSGLWAAEVLGMTGLLASVSRLLETDEDVGVRTRAARCTRRLIARARLEIEHPAEGGRGRRSEEAVAA